METKTKDTRWIVELEEDPETGELVMPLPIELLEEMGWRIGDTLEWNAGKDNTSFKLTRKNE